MSYTKVEWKTGEVVKPAHVTINGVEHNITPEERTGATPINVSNLNNMDDGIYENDLNITKTNENISSAYDSTKTYELYDYCIYNNELYKCNTAIETAEEFDETKWEKVNVTNEIKSNRTKFWQYTLPTAATSFSASSWVNVYTPAETEVLDVGVYMLLLSCTGASTSGACTMTFRPTWDGAEINYRRGSIYAPSTTGVYSETVTAIINITEENAGKIHTIGAQIYGTSTFRLSYAGTAQLIKLG